MSQDWGEGIEVKMGGRGGGGLRYLAGLIGNYPCNGRLACDSVDCNPCTHCCGPISCSRFLRGSWSTQTTCMAITSL